MLDDNQKMIALAAAGITVAVIIINKALTPHIGDREPPMLKPQVPFIGHIVGLIKEGGLFPDVLYKKYKMPIATLPMLNQKMYMVWDPALIQGVLKSRDLSFYPFAMEFWEHLTGVDPKHLVVLEDDPTILPRMFDDMHIAMRGEPLLKMNVSALKHISERLDGIQPGKGVEIPNLYLYIRDMATMATATALYGEHNPFAKDASLIEDLWTVDNGLVALMMVPLPSVFARETVKARSRVQAALSEYYVARHDHGPTAAAVTKQRGDAIRDVGFSDELVAKSEIALPFVAMANTAPATFWVVAHIFSRPELLAQVREEVAPVVHRRDDGIAMVNLRELEENCPLLVSCYRETLRLMNFFLGGRRVLRDMTLSDGKGNAYLLKEGSNLQFPAIVAHRFEDVWGEDATEFRADRFVPGAKSEGDKARRAAYFPFGGGRHLCPGRNFAFAEILALIVALASGFELTGVSDGKDVVLELPRLDRQKMPVVIGKPVADGAGSTARLSRREGWEDVKWRFEC